MHAQFRALRNQIAEDYVIFQPLDVLVHGVFLFLLDICVNGGKRSSCLDGIDIPILQLIRHFCFNLAIPNLSFTKNCSITNVSSII